MNYTTWTPANEGAVSAERVNLHSLYQALQGLSDCRRPQGKRYELALVLTLLVLAKLAGQKTLSGATQWIRAHATLLAEHFGLQQSRMPCQMTYCNVLAHVDAVQLDALVSAFFVRWEAQDRCGEEPSRLLSPQAQREHRHLARDSQNRACHH